MRNVILDDLDRKLLEKVSACPGLKMADLIRDFKTKWSDPGLRLRVRSLEKAGLIRLEQTRQGRQLAYPLK